MKIPKGNFTYYPTHTLPSALDIVWCRFPLQEWPDKPGPKERPALVRSVALYANQRKVAVEVTYGTSRIHKANPLDLQISNCEDMAASGLYQATVFMLDKTILLPWSVEFFAIRDGYKTPIVGHLPSAASAQLETLKVLRRRGIR